MPNIILTKEYKRGDKVFEKGTTYFCSWSGYREMLEEGYCNKLDDDKQVKKTKKVKPEVKPLKTDS
ncbi:MAG: hypothetical protein CMC15_15300 [Flavobacteriaceae bacterium]|nr:hypothetical protein [Flavobacteriaceae bacterium]|tara:strand:+ start:376 stop:573 length:198 start_codon:yes stop_codon:yes gene_type:complete